MSTLRISNIEAKADSSSPTVDEQLRFTNSDGDLMLYLDGRTAGITTVGINTTNQTIKFDANNNILITGIVTATEFHGALAVGTSVTYGDNEKEYFGTGLDLELFHNGTNSVINNTTGALLFQNNGSSSMYIGSTGQVYLNNDITFVGASANALWDKSENYFSIPDKIVHSGDTNTAVRFPADDTFTVETAGSTRLRAENSGVVITGVTSITASAHISNANGSVFFGAGSATAYGSQGGIGRASNANYHIGNSAVGDLCIAAEGSKRILFGTKTGTGIGGIIKRMSIASNGTVTIDGNLDAVGGIDATANSTFAGDIDVDGQTHLDHVSISGVTTTSGNLTANHSNGQVTLKPSDGSIEITRTAGSAYIDFKNDTSEDYDVRINEEGGNLRVNKHFRLYDDKALELGNRTSSTFGDLRIFHDSSAGNNVIEGHTSSLNLRNYNTNSTDINLSARNDILLQTAVNENAIWCDANAGVHLYYNGAQKLVTDSTGIDVTGEVAASQDYPNFRPSLDLNFAATKRLDSRITYTRSGRASFTNQHGLLEIVNANEPRFDHDPVTRECKGLLIEEERTNILTYSNIKGMSSPNLGGNPQTNDTVSNITLPTGEKGDVRRYLANAGGGGGRWGGYSGNANVPKTGSVWVRTVSGTGSAVIDIADGGQETINLTTEWQRVTATHTPSNAYEFFDIYFENPVTIYYWGVQIEEGAFMTSYIPTNNATVTRGVDTVMIDGENFTEFYNPVESTILMDYTHDFVTSSQLGGSARTYRFRAVGGSDTRIDYVSNSGYNPYIAKDGAAVASISHGQSTVFGGGLNRNAVRVKENSFAVSFNGSTVVEDTSGAWNPSNTITEVSLGSGTGGNPLNGHIQRFTYYPIGVSNSQLVTLTS